MAKEDQNIEIRVSLKDYLSAQAKIVAEQIEKIGDEAQFSAGELKYLERELGRMRKDALKAAIAAKGAAEGVEQVGDEAVKSATKLAILQAKLKGLNEKSQGSGAKFFDLLKKLKWTAILGGGGEAIGALTQGILGLGAAAYAGIAGLAPLAGLMVAYPGYLAAFGQGALVAKWSLNNLGEAIAALNDPNADPEVLAMAMGKLGKNGQQLARTVSSLKSPLDKLKGQIQEGLAPSLNKILEIFRDDMFKDFSYNMRSVASAIKVFTDGLGKWLGTKENQQMVSRIMQGNAKILAYFSKTGLTAFDALVNVLDAANPMLILMSESIAKFFEKIAVNTRDNKDGLGKFFMNAFKLAQGVYLFLKNIFVGLWNIGKASLGLAGEMGKSLLGISENFAKWTGSKEGQKTMKKFFDDMRPVVWEIGYLIRDLGAALFDIGQDTSFTASMKSIRTELLPALVKFIKVVSNAGFISALSSLLSSITSISSESYTFQAITDIMEAFAVVLKGIAWMMSLVPEPIMKLLGYFFAFKIFLAPFKIFSKIFGFFKPQAAGAASPLTRIKNIFQAIGTAIKWAAGKFKSLFGWIGKLFSPLGKVFGWLGKIANSPIGKLLGKFTGLLGVLLSIWDVASNLFGEDGKAGKSMNSFIGTRDALNNIQAGKNADGSEKPLAWNYGAWQTEQRAFGGDVLAGRNYIVGELGTEGFLSASGKFSMIGDGGAELRKFNESGVVIPNHIMSAVARAMSDKPVGAEALMVARSKNNEMKQEAMQVTIGEITVNQASEFDVIQAVQKGIAKAEKNMRERR